MNKPYFIYVFTTEEYKALIAAGYHCLKADMQNQIFVFENTSEFKFDAQKLNFILSDTLTF